MVIGSLGWIIVPLIKNRLLIHRGRIIDGMLIEAKQEREKGEDILTMKYGFHSPRNERWLTRRELRTEWQMLQGDESNLAGQRIFAEGTPVKILYLNDHMYRVL